LGECWVETSWAGCGTLALVQDKSLSAGGTLIISGSETPLTFFVANNTSVACWVTVESIRTDCNTFCVQKIESVLTCLARSRGCAGGALLWTGLANGVCGYDELTSSTGCGTGFGSLLIVETSLARETLVRVRTSTSLAGGMTFSASTCSFCVVELWAGSDTSLVEEDE
jgi:hypothetical protein